MEPRKTVAGRPTEERDIALSRYRDNDISRRPGAESGKPEGGFAFVRALDLCRLWQSYQVGLIEFRDVRTWFACHEMLARRCELDRERLPTFTLSELGKLVGGAGKGLKGSLERLQEADVLLWSETLVRFPIASQTSLAALPGLASMLESVTNHRRLVPIPRRTLRLLAQTGKPSVVATMLGHMLRCLYYRQGECVSWGTCKSSWLAETFGIDTRNVKAARRHLLGLGWLIRLDSNHWHRQRWGGSFVISLAWSRPDSYADKGRASTGAAADVGTKSPPRPADSGTKSPPPSKQVSSLREFKNQKPAQSRPAGFSVKEGEGKTKPPNWRHVVVEDLKDTSRLLELFELASIAGDVGRSEYDRLRFATAAEHALVKGKANRSGLFVHLVKKKLWHFCTQDDEDAARERLKREIFGVTREREPEPKPKTRRIEFTRDQKLALGIAAAAEKHRLVPMVIIRSMKLDWSLEQYERHFESAETVRLQQLVANRGDAR